MLERLAVADEFRVETVDGGDAAQREVFFTLARRTDTALHHVAGLESVLLYLLLGYIDVVGASEIVVVARTEETVALGHDFEKALGHKDAVEVETRYGALGHLALCLLLLALTHALALAHVFASLGLRLCHKLSVGRRFADCDGGGGRSHGRFLYLALRTRSERLAACV